MIESVAKKLQSAGILFLKEEPLSLHTSFKIGGNAAIFCTPKNVAELCDAIKICRQENVKHYILGKGSNVLFCDERYEGVIISVATQMCDIEVDAENITACAGTPLSKLCTVAAENSLSGLEFAYGIPGGVGGAVYMNAGAYGGEIIDVLTSVVFLDDNGEVRELMASQLELGYRTSVFEKRDWVILSAKFTLKHDDKEVIQAKMRELAKKRTDKQPLDMPSAGSTFKRPKDNFAGALIDKCGLSGYSVGGAQVSTKHCGFVVNKGGATCKDVLMLADEICEIVHRETGVMLEKEIRVVK